jgi:hypothetical protein
METIYVIMLKDSKTGFLEKELGSITLSAFDEYIINLFVTDEDGKQSLNLRLSTGRDVEDWEYDAIYDYYDCDVMNEIGGTVCETDDDYNPVWLVTIPFDGDIEKAEQNVETVLKRHFDELTDVFETIKDKKEDYTNEE